MQEKLELLKEDTDALLRDKEVTYEKVQHLQENNKKKQERNYELLFKVFNCNVVVIMNYFNAYKNSREWVHITLKIFILKVGQIEGNGLCNVESVSSLDYQGGIYI